MLPANGMVQPVAAAAKSPWTDLALTGDGFETRAGADPISTRVVLQAFADMHLQGQDATHPGRRRADPPSPQMSRKRETGEPATGLCA